MKRNNSTELSGESLIIFDMKMPRPDPPRTQIRICSWISRIFYRKLLFFLFRSLEIENDGWEIESCVVAIYRNCKLILVGGMLKSQILWFGIPGKPNECWIGGRGGGGTCPSRPTIRSINAY